MFARVLPRTRSPSAATLERDRVASRELLFGRLLQVWPLSTSPRPSLAVYAFATVYIRLFPCRCHLLAHLNATCPFVCIRDRTFSLAMDESLEHWNDSFLPSLYRDGGSIDDNYLDDSHITTYAHPFWLVRTASLTIDTPQPNESPRTRQSRAHVFKFLF